jgi:hypothetical protein
MQRQKRTWNHGFSINCWEASVSLVTPEARLKRVSEPFTLPVIARGVVSCVTRIKLNDPAPLNDFGPHSKTAARKSLWTHNGDNYGDRPRVVKSNRPVCSKPSVGR